MCPEIAPLQEEGFRHWTWHRGPASFTDGQIVLDRSRATEYAPLVSTDDDLVFQLAAVQTPDDALAFTQRYGLLLSRADEDPAESFEGIWLTVAETFREWFEALRTIQLLRADDPGDEGAAAMAAWCSSGVKVMTVDASGPVRSEWDAATVADLGAQRLATAVTSWMDDAVRIGVAPDSELDGDGSRFVLAPRPTHLAAYAVYRFSLLLVRDVSIRRCEDCGRAFEVTDKRKRFCDQTCAGRARQRRWTRKKKEEVEGNG